MGGARRDRPRLHRRHLACLRRRRRRRRGSARRLRGAAVEAELLIHTGDDPGRDILEGSADVAFIGGFAAALAALGRSADLIALDTTDPARPRRALGRRGCRPRRARPRRQSALHRGPDAARPARRLRIRRDGRPAGRLCRDHQRHSRRADRGRARRLSSATQRCATSSCARTRPPRAPSPSVSPRRAGAASGIPLRNSIDDDLAALIAEARAQEIAA